MIAVTHRPRGRLEGRNSWSALLAVVLGVLAGLSASGLSASFAGGPSIVEHGTDARSTSKPSSVRPDRLDPSLNLGGLDDPAAALAARGHESDLWADARPAVPPVAIEVTADIARTRDGRTRAPPHA
jgi:hypothetical protein